MTSRIKSLFFLVSLWVRALGLLAIFPLNLGARQKLLYWTGSTALLHSIFHWLNRLNRVFAAPQVRRDEQTILNFAQVLQQYSHGINHQPCLIFIYVSPSAPPFGFMEWVAVSSAMKHNKNLRPVLLAGDQPTGKYWMTLRDQVDFIQLPDFSFFKGAKFFHPAHKSDVFRLLAVYYLGGVYLDFDTITLKPIPAPTSGVILGAQPRVYPFSGGLCGAVIIGNRLAPFLRHWMDCYSSFISRGRDWFWDYHSVKLPVSLAARHPEELEIVDFNRFFYPHWLQINSFVFSEGSAERYGPYLADLVVVHLWNQHTKESLKVMDEHAVKSSTSLYAEWVRIGLAEELMKLGVEVLKVEQDEQV